MKGKNIN